MDMISPHKPDILSLMEPKVSGAQADEICLNVGFANWVRVEAFGFSDGIWIFWKEEVIVDIVCTNPQFILLQVSDGGDPPWNLSVVYGSSNGMLRDKLWDELCSSFFNFDGPWFSVGDYIAVVSSKEVSPGGNLAHYRCGKFLDWIFKQGLMDISFSGSKFTWFCGLNSNTFQGTRLDQGLCNVEWRILFPDAQLSHLPRVQYDHAPLLVNLCRDSQNQVPKPFRFQMV